MKFKGLQSPFVQNIVKDISSVVGNVITEPAKADEFKTEFDLVSKQLDYDKYTQQLNDQIAMILAEEKSDNWLQRNWRPLLMVLFGVIILNKFIIIPYLEMIFGKIDALNIVIPPEMWDLLKLGVSGYIVGRSAEKVVDKWKNQ